MRTRASAASVRHHCCLLLLQKEEEEEEAYPTTPCHSSAPSEAPGNMHYKLLSIHLPMASCGFSPRGVIIQVLRRPYLPHQLPLTTHGDVTLSRQHTWTTC